MTHMPKYIIVTGTSNSGKTTSIRALWELLGGKVLPDSPSDFHDILIYNNKRIGFHSWGDTVDYLDKHKGGIPDFKNCDFIISACKSSGKTQEYFVNLCKIEDLYWVGKVIQGNATQSAKQIASHTKLIIDSL